jgi:hypothetical protein
MDKILFFISSEARKKILISFSTINFTLSKRRVKPLTLKNLIFNLKLQFLLLN